MTGGAGLQQVEAGEGDTSAEWAESAQPALSQELAEILAAAAIERRAEAISSWLICYK